MDPRLPIMTCPKIYTQNFTVSASDNNIKENKEILERFVFSKQKLLCETVTSSGELAINQATILTKETLKHLQKHTTCGIMPTDIDTQLNSIISQPRFVNMEFL